MPRSPRQIYKKYRSQGATGLLLGALEHIVQQLDRTTHPLILKKYDSGDIVSYLDCLVHNSVVEYFRANEIPILILGEEGECSVANPEWILLIDEIEGSQNAINGLDYGINMAIAHYQPQIRGDELEAAVVCNLRDSRVFVSERGKGAYKIVNGKRCELSHKPTDVWEIPSPYAYTTTTEQVKRQVSLSRIFSARLGNQPRSIDATGTRLAGLADSDIRAYGDWRNVTKCWDVLPSALILREAGYRITDVFGFDFTAGILYDEHNPNYREHNGLNIRLGENFIAASPEEHELLIFGSAGKGSMRVLPMDCVWDIILTKTRHYPPQFIGCYFPCDLPLRDALNRFGEAVAFTLLAVIQDRRVAYGSLDPENIIKITKKIREHYLPMDSKFLPESKPVHLWAFDKTIVERKERHPREFGELQIEYGVKL
ncbi:hypothetical protein DRJ48_00515 [Candidatus Woesearchaeota archaeon]|nr:hypothetical protein [Candidatus Woesearchaeota archaeon]RLE43578.1 MAG: hypothetical protein DRJ48_00515 [Candidatus Woesearchaeota archaeon]